MSGKSRFTERGATICHVIRSMEKNGGKINAASPAQFRAFSPDLVRSRPLADHFAQLVAGPSPLNRSSFDINSTHSQKLAARTGAI
jgi:hypothetical protein